MKSTEFELSVHISTTPLMAYEHLSNLANHPGLQPLIIETQEIANGQNEQGYSTKRFISIEQFHFFGIIPYRNKIEVLMTLLPEHGVVVQEVHSFPNIYLRSSMTFKAAKEGTAVHETVLIHSPTPLMGYVRQTAVAAHQTLMQNLKIRLEKESTYA